DVTVAASSLTSSIDITAAASEPTPSVIDTNAVTTTSNKKQNRMDTLSDLTVQLNEITEDRDKWRDNCSALEKRYSELSDVSMLTARKLFQQICLDELTEGLLWSKIPDNKIEAIHAFGEKLFGHLKWDRKTIKTSLQNLIRAERSNLKRDQKNGCPNEQNLDHKGLVVVESVPEHTE
ncbi:unnamed protein product, partial [Didymodactylos carnosus]